MGSKALWAGTTDLPDSQYLTPLLKSGLVPNLNDIGFLQPLHTEIVPHLLILQGYYIDSLLMLHKTSTENVVFDDAIFIYWEKYITENFTEGSDELEWCLARVTLLKYLHAYFTSKAKLPSLVEEQLNLYARDLNEYHMFYGVDDPALMLEFERLRLVLKPELNNAFYKLEDFVALVVSRAAEFGLNLLSKHFPITYNWDED